LFVFFLLSCFSLFYTFLLLFLVCFFCCHIAWWIM
jgi:hypothetical protein